MEIDRQHAEHNLRGKLLLKVRRLVAQVVFLTKRHAKVGEAHNVFELV